MNVVLCQRGLIHVYIPMQSVHICTKKKNLDFFLDFKRPKIIRSTSFFITSKKGNSQKMLWNRNLKSEQLSLFIRVNFLLTQSFSKTTKKFHRISFYFNSENSLYVEKTSSFVSVHRKYVWIKWNKILKQSSPFRKKFTEAKVPISSLNEYRIIFSIFVCCCW